VKQNGNIFVKEEKKKFMWRILRMFKSEKKIEFLSKVYGGFGTYLLCLFRIKKIDINLLIDGSPSFIYTDDGRWTKFIGSLPCSNINVFKPINDCVEVFSYPTNDKFIKPDKFLDKINTFAKHTPVLNPLTMFEDLKLEETKFTEKTGNPFKTITVSDGCDNFLHEAFQNDENYVHLFSHEGTKENNKLPHVVSYEQH